MTADEPNGGPLGGPTGEPPGNEPGPEDPAEDSGSGGASPGDDSRPGPSAVGRTSSPNGDDEPGTSAGDPSASGSEGLSRRQLIGLLVGAVAVAAGGSVSVTLLRGEHGETDAGVDEDGLVAVGRRAQQVLPEGGDAEALAVALGLPGGPPSPDDDAETLERQLTDAADRIQDDYATGDTITIDGWVLALTEARLCALIALAR